ncbi:ABC transporter ATP-binding protein [Novipirellula artificiosorum]|uniref:Daunorubicin/doxorubicin resistance ATP-binding protein DrrA n=1 Tax=Novipirellula artificiosorum TaxID=2528016 RepID=A0A5C6D5N3_9BACT|nr:ABC transporter ATP-binding protein [Novipirellula artificiosorum]TWU31345.1 Daunorubicin/doxorubicin resistance ATP-binding protein DrrA [Novipirellula artificiosorum]
MTHSKVLAVDRLFKAFGDIHAVSGVSFAINAGEVYGLLGPNGAGKTTTIDMICGLRKPDSGTVSINGKDFSIDPKSAQQSMGVVPQEVALYEELSAEENLLFWGKLAGLSSKLAKERTEHLLHDLMLTDRRRDAVRTYSGGMKRRVNIGCALLHNPQLLLLDEPTVGIDPQARANILEFVRGLTAQGTGVLYTTHYLEEAETLCDRIGIIDHGKLLAEGTLQELQNRLSGDRLFVLEGDFANADPKQWTGFADRFRILSQREHQLILASVDERHPSDCLRELLDIPVRVDNAMVKKPNLNDVFLQLTGRELRE